MIDKLFSNTKILEKSLNATWARNDTIAQNLANIDTPGYKRKDIAFEQYLSDAIDKNKLEGRITDKRHIPINNSDINKVEPVMTEDNSELSMRIDGNNVDIDSEMANLAKNQIQFNTLTQLISGEFNKIKSVINEGRR